MRRRRRRRRRDAARPDGAAVAFQVYDIDNDGFIGNGELFTVLKKMCGDNLADTQLQQIGATTRRLGGRPMSARLNWARSGQDNYGL